MYCTPLAAPPAADHVPYWCHGLEVYPGSCSGLYLLDLCCPTPGTRGRSSLRSSEQRLLFVPFARTSSPPQPRPVHSRWLALLFGMGFFVANIAPQDSF